MCLLLWNHEQYASTPSTGLQIIFNLDEVSFIQNLVFYIESAYCVPVSVTCLCPACLFAVAAFHFHFYSLFFLEHELSINVNEIDPNM